VPNTIESATSDTIAAIATPAGRGGIGIVRLSGPSAFPICKELVGSVPKVRLATFKKFAFKDEVIDEGLVITFRNPASFTGEDVVELHGHGGPVVMDMLLKACLGLGARQAKPGEFSERAFLNGKIDLTQAEAIADLIASQSATAARSASRSLQGEFSDKVAQLLTDLIELRIYVEAALDFPEEEIDFLSDGIVAAKLKDLKQTLNATIDNARQGQLLRDGLNIVIAGRPNAGKSSLLNALAGEEAAIVSEVAGTTRDMVRAEISLDGLPLHIVDTAGLHNSDDPVEKIGIQRAQEAIAEADLVILLRDDSADDLVPDITTTVPVVVVNNKVDLSGKTAGLINKEINLSVVTGAGLPALKTHLKNYAGYKNEGEGIFIARRRHLDALQRTMLAIEKAEHQLLKFNAGELSAEELRLAQDALAEITGQFTSDDLLGEIFSSFCIGK